MTHRFALALPHHRSRARARLRFLHHPRALRSSGSGVGPRLAHPETPSTPPLLMLPITRAFAFSHAPVCWPRGASCRRHALAPYPAGRRRWDSDQTKMALGAAFGPILRCVSAIISLYPCLDLAGKIANQLESLETVFALFYKLRVPSSPAGISQATGPVRSPCDAALPQR
jgi:hypothetical protein